MFVVVAGKGVICRGCSGVCGDHTLPPIFVAGVVVVVLVARSRAVLALTLLPTKLFFTLALPPIEPLFTFALPLIEPPLYVGV